MVFVIGDARTKMTWLLSMGSCRIHPSTVFHEMPWALIDKTYLKMTYLKCTPQEPRNYIFFQRTIAKYRLPLASIFVCLWPQDIALFLCARTLKLSIHGTFHDLKDMSSHQTDENDPKTRCNQWFDANMFGTNIIISFLLTHFGPATSYGVVKRCFRLMVFGQFDSNPWASYQIRKIAGCARAGNAGNVFPPPTSKETAS